jgi:hypothetical protein
LTGVQRISFHSTLISLSLPLRQILHFAAVLVASPSLHSFARDSSSIACERYSLYFVIDNQLQIFGFSTLHFPNPILSRKFAQWPRQLQQCRNPINIPPSRKVEPRPTTCSINICQDTSRRTTSEFNQPPSTLTAQHGTTAFGAASLLPNSVSFLLRICVSLCCSFASVALRGGRHDYTANRIFQ